MSLDLDALSDDEKAALRKIMYNQRARPVRER
jgi:hypothetical protein